MKVTMEKAKSLALDRILANIIKEVERQIENCEPFDTRPEGGFYSNIRYDEAEYWYLPYPKIGCEYPRAMKIGGDETYIAVSKVTGEVSTITIYGE
ncbi:hypothetical protein [Desulfosediminicola ganghwensis]|uniref:hypothetical protein n=1 Tax=Desulfosediminicola ganghwensis TaxID=2569540 RepID=UPI0010AB7543|nr:hypothetical protein [Desulfosediminicola ganghwensis]